MSTILHQQRKEEKMKILRKIKRIISEPSPGDPLIQCCNKLKYYYLLSIIFLYSCDIGHMQTFEGYNSTLVKLHNSESTTRVSCMYFHGCYYLNYSIMKGEFTVNYDSLKLQTNDDNLLIYKNLPDKGIHTYKIRKEWVLSIRLGFNRKDTSIGVADPLVLSIQPSDFITFNGKRITNDTLRVELKPGLKFY